MAFGGLLVLTGAARQDVDLTALWSAPSNQLRESFSDSGVTTDVAVVRSVIGPLLADEQQVAKIPDEALSVSSTTPDPSVVESARQVTARRTALAAVSSPDRTAWVLPAIEYGLHQNVTDPQFLDTSYRDSTFSIDVMEGVHVEGDRATVLFRGAASYQALSGAWHTEPQSQYLVALVRSEDSPRGWLLDKVTKRVVSNSNAPSR